MYVSIQFIILIWVNKTKHSSSQPVCIYGFLIDFLIIIYSLVYICMCTYVYKIVTGYKDLWQLTVARMLNWMYSDGKSIWMMAARWRQECGARLLMYFRHRTTCINKLRLYNTTELYIYNIYSIMAWRRIMFSSVVVAKIFCARIEN